MCLPVLVWLFKNQLSVIILTKSVIKSYFNRTESIIHHNSRIYITNKIIIEYLHFNYIFYSRSISVDISIYSISIINSCNCLIIVLRHSPHDATLVGVERGNELERIVRSWLESKYQFSVYMFTWWWGGWAWSKVYIP